MIWSVSIPPVCRLRRHALVYPPVACGQKFQTAQACAAFFSGVIKPGSMIFSVTFGAVATRSLKISGQHSHFTTSNFIGYAVFPGSWGQLEDCMTFRLSHLVVTGSATLPQEFWQYSYLSAPRWFVPVRVATAEELSLDFVATHGWQPGWIHNDLTLGKLAGRFQVFVLGLL